MRTRLPGRFAQRQDGWAVNAAIASLPESTVPSSSGDAPATAKRPCLGSTAACSFFPLRGAGAGASSGTHDEGEGEQQAVLAAIDWVVRCHPGRKSSSTRWRRRCGDGWRRFWRMGS